jgi:hypothetical protein
VAGPQCILPKKILEKRFQESPHIIVSSNHVEIEQCRPFQGEDQSQRQADATLVNVQAARLPPKRSEVRHQTSENRAAELFAASARDSFLRFGMQFSSDLFHLSGGKAIIVSGQQILWHIRKELRKSPFQPINLLANLGSPLEDDPPYEIEDPR